MSEGAAMWVSDTGGADRPDPPPTPFRTLLCPLGHEMAGFDAPPKDRGCRTCQANDVNPYGNSAQRAGRLGGIASGEARQAAAVDRWLESEFVEIGLVSLDDAQAEAEADAYARWARDVSAADHPLPGD